MKLFNKTYIMAGALALCSVGFSACDNETVYDFPGDPSNKVYTADHSVNAKVIKTPSGTIGSLDVAIPAKCNRNAAEDIKVNLAVDNSLIEEYNTQNETEFKAAPEGLFIIENTNLTIPKGEMASADSCFIKLTDDTDMLESLNAGDEYIVPIRISEIKGGNAVAAVSVPSISYLKLTVSEKLINDDATSCNGTLVSDRSGWKIYGSSPSCNIQYDYAVFNGSFYDWCLIDNGAEECDVIVDMGKEYTFDGVLSSYYNYWPGHADGAVFSYSLDGKKWSDIGSKYAQRIYLYAPVTARYLKFNLPNNNGYGHYTYTSEINVYAL